MMKLTGSWEIQKKGVQLVGQKFFYIILYSPLKITLVFFLFLFLFSF